MSVPWPLRLLVCREHVPDWQDSHAMSAYVPPSQLGQWIQNGSWGSHLPRLWVRNAPLREQVVRRLTQDAHTNQILESLPCELHLKVTLHRRCLPGCSPQSCATRGETLRPRLSTVFIHPCCFPMPLHRELSPAPFPSGGGGGSLSLSPYLSSPSLSLFLRGPTFSQFSVDGASEDSTFGTQTILAMRKFLDDAELCSHQEISTSLVTKGRYE